MMHLIQNVHGKDKSRTYSFVWSTELMWEPQGRQEGFLDRSGSQAAREQ